MDINNDTTEQVINLLRNASPATWTKAVDISTALGGIDRRTIAAAAAASAGRIIACGTGYKLSDVATDDDILRCYTETVRKALGSDLRARSIISWARRHGRLQDPNIERKTTVQVQAELGIPAAVQAELFA